MDIDLAWESKLIRKAKVDYPLSHVFLHKTSSEALNSSYEYCRKITRIHSKSFYMASGLFPKEKKRAIRALYAFCRTSDDIIDLQGSEALEDLKIWRIRGMQRTPRVNDPVAIAWADSRKNFNIPSKYGYQLLDGVAQDINFKTYKDFSELSEYCYGVASTVGLMSMYITGFDGEHAIPYAIKLGVALQLTNILRDIAEDYKMGRVYLPQDELDEYGIEDRHLRDGIVDDKWRKFMQFQIARTRALYVEALPGIALLDASGRLPIAAAAIFYRGILDKIEELEYNIFKSRAQLSKWEKVGMIPRIWYEYVATSNNKRKKEIIS